MKTLVLILMPLLLHAAIGDTTDIYIIYDEDPIIAEPGTSAVILCTFNPPAEFTPTSVVLQKCEFPNLCHNEHNIFDSENVSATTGQFRGRVFLLEPDLTKKNCSIRIDDLTISMTGGYQIQINGLKDIEIVWELRTLRKKPINVTGLKQPRILGETVEEGGTLNLTCEAESSPPSNVTWTLAGHPDTLLMSGIQTATLVIPNVTTEHNGSVYICTAKHLEKMKTALTHVFVTRLKQPRILGETTVEEGGTLNLTCEAESSPPANVTWTIAGSDTPLMSGIQTATLVIPNMTTEHNGSVYICTAKHLGKMKTALTRVFVTTIQKTQDIFLRVWLPIVVLVGAVALAAMIYYFYRRGKTGGEPRGQADAPQVVIPQDQQETGDGDGSAGQEQTFQEGEVAEEVELLRLSSVASLPAGSDLPGEEEEALKKL